MTLLRLRGAVETEHRRDSLLGALRHQCILRELRPQLAGQLQAALARRHQPLQLAHAQPQRAAGRGGDDPDHDDGGGNDPGAVPAPPFLELVFADGLVDLMKCGGIRQGWLPDYRGISTASGAVHSPPPELWQTTERGILAALYRGRRFCNNSSTRHDSSRGCMTNLYRFADQRARRRNVSFDRRVLYRPLGLYSLRVASREWRGYAIDFRPGMAIFSIFRHTAEQPLYAIATVPGATANGSGGGYMVYNGPRKLAHGESLEDVLRVFDRKLRILLG